MTRRRWAAVAAALGALLPFLLPGVVRAAEPDPLPPAPGLVLELADRGGGWAQYQWRDPVSGGLYELDRERRIHEPARAVPGVAIPTASGDDVPGLIRSAARRWGLDGERMVRICRCESGLDPRAYNRRSGASGLFQFLGSTYAATPQGRAGLDVFDPAANTEAAMWLMATYGPGQWVCK